VERDLALLVDAKTLCGDVISIIKEHGGNFLEKVELFDVYQGAQVEEGKKSMAFNLIFVSMERTLNVEEIDQTINAVLVALKEKIGAELR
jgi:phenylalanyl-tRNA synthetase beta chain